MPAGRPSKYKPGIIPELLELAAEGKSLAQISAVLDIPRTTMRSWGEEHTEFSSALTRAKELEQNWWEQTVQDNLIIGKDDGTVQSSLIIKSMQARFREEYTERKEVAATVTEEPPDKRKAARAILELLNDASKDT